MYYTQLLKTTPLDPKGNVALSGDKPVKNATRLVFHSSPQVNRKSIAQSGLLANPSGGRIWKFQNPAIFAHLSLYGAMQWEAYISDMLVDNRASLPPALRSQAFERCDIWVINTEGLPFYNDDHHTSAVAMQSQEIEPERLYRLDWRSWNRIYAPADKKTKQKKQANYVEEMRRNVISRKLVEKQDLAFHLLQRDMENWLGTAVEVF